MAEDRKNGTVKGLEPDSKSQITFRYSNGLPEKITSVVISTQHSEDLNQNDVKELLSPYLKKAIPVNFFKVPI